MSAKKTREPLPELSLAACAEAEAWLADNRESLLPSVADALTLSLRLAAKMTATDESRRSILLELRRALGITPSTERRKNSGDPLAGDSDNGGKGRLTAHERLTSQNERSERLAKWYRMLARRHGKKATDLKGQIMELEDIPLSPEEEAELAQEHAEYSARLGLGQRCDMDCAAPTETLMTGMAAHIRTEAVDCQVDRDGLSRGAVVTQEFFEDRQRISFSFTVTRLDIAVEKLAVKTDAGTTLVAASLDQVGPPKRKVTWEFLASMAILVAQYAMPLNRFAGLASSSAKRFTAAEMSRYFHYVAERLVAVYLELGRSLANSAVLAGDDTPSRVIEVVKTLAALAADERVEVPWSGYASADEAKASLKGAVKSTLAVTLAAELGFAFDKKDGKGAKQGFNTTVVSGRQDAADPRSTVIFFRSHMGGLGNLLTKILTKRNANNPDVVIQSDLSTVNLICDEALRQRLRAKLAGCTYHARRPFALHEGDDPELCAWMLHCFKGLAIFEGALDVHGRNRENTAAVRGCDERAAWEQIKEIAGLIASKWSRESELGKGARYILKHFERLTYYLDDHRLAPSNNFSERMLRTENLIENNALFRQSLEGRFALDIVRTVLQTAVAAHVNLDKYLNWLMRMPPDVVTAAPAEFTPFAYSRLHSQLQ